MSLGVALFLTVLCIVGVFVCLAAWFISSVDRWDDRDD